MKIAVIADDLTGAAEIAGVAKRYGLSAEVQVGRVFPSTADVLAIDADSRSQPAEVAYARVFALTQQAIAAKVDLLYKKVDSLLRGPVLIEVAAAQAAAGLDQCLLVCGNPRKRRLVTQGTISIDGRPLHETEFALDPEHPRLSSCAVTLLEGGAQPTELRQRHATPDRFCVIAPGEAFDSALAIGDVAHADDLDLHARHWLLQRGNTLAAGSSEFFEAILSCAHHPLGTSRASQPSPDIDQGLSADEKVLLISGTRFSRSEGWSVVPFRANGCLTDWIMDARQTLASAQRIAIRASDLDTIPQVARVPLLTRISVSLLSGCTPAQVWIEGGRTASAVMRELNIERLFAIGEVSDGTVAFRNCVSASPLFLIKPGSYPWPSFMSASSGLAQSIYQEMA